MGSDTDEAKLKALMQDSLDGDAVAYRSLLGTLSSLFMRYFLARVDGNRSIAEDLTQETLLALHAKRATFDRRRDFTPWAYALARYKWVDHCRRMSRRPQPLSDVNDPENEAATSDDHALAGTDVQRLLGRLPAAQAHAIHLTRLVGMTGPEAAASLDTSESSIKVRVHRGLKTLQTLLAGERRRFDE